MKPSPSIAHWLRYKGRPETTIRWIDRNGQKHEIRGRIEGAGVTPSGVQKLIVTTVRQEGRVAKREQHLIPSGALRRYLDSIGETPQTQPRRVREDYCGDCGKLLGSGRIGHLDGTVVPGLCFNCA